MSSHGSYNSDPSTLSNAQLIDSQTVSEAFQGQLEGEAYFDQITRSVYSVDASIFEVAPLGVIIPKTLADLQRTVQIARALRIPLTARGAATGTTGSALGHGLVVDLSKYFNRIIAIDINRQQVVCEPGVIQDDLNRALAVHGYRLGPDTSTGNRATLGGMLANNAAGARSLRYGAMVDHIIATDVLLADGQSMHFAPLSLVERDQKQRLSNREGALYRDLQHIADTYQAQIMNDFPHTPRRVSGYNLEPLLLDPLNVSRLIAGSEGTLGIVHGLTLRIVPQLQTCGLLLLFFDDLLAALHLVPHLLTYNPLALELVDDQIVELGRAAPSMRERLTWLHGHPKAILIAEFEGVDQTAVQDQINHVLAELPLSPHHFASFSAIDPHLTADVWALRQAGLGILLSRRTYSRAAAFMEDIAVPPLQLPAFMGKFCAYLASKGKQAGIYGHVGPGCMHIRPYIDLRNPQEVALMRTMMLDISQMLQEHGGIPSGEHGDGLIRSWLNPHFFSLALMQAFKELKQAFDPDNLMNPGKVVPLDETWEPLRWPLNTAEPKEKTYLDFSREGGFSLAVDMCNGNGQCRKREGIMCPSFQVTNTEFHSTRARAQALRDLIWGRLPSEAWTSEKMHDVMELCISCKGCKTECPSQVDMAKMKAEWLYRYQETHGYDLRSRLFADIGTVQRWLSPMASFFNWSNRQSFVKKGLAFFGIAPERTLPALAKQRFSDWLANFSQPAHLTRTAVLLNDTFNEFNNPEIGQAAVRLLNALGYRTVSPPWSCCGRPALSRGFLPLARRQATALVETLTQCASDDVAIIGLEPSCLLTLRDDFLSLLDREELRIACMSLIERCVLIDEFLARQVRNGTFNLPFQEISKRVLVHGHCHQKALVGMQMTLEVLRAVPGFEVSLIDSGCCGMAGAFGYEREHYAISMEMGELKLFPTLRAAAENTLVVANGMSCRHQIVDGTGQRALHLVEAIVQQLHNNSKIRF